MPLIFNEGYKYYKTPHYPDFPYAEYKSRIERAQKLMIENGVDCMVLWSRQNLRYFFGFQCTHWQIPSIQPGVGVIPDKGDPRIIVPDFFIGSVEQQCWIRDVIQQVDCHQPNNIRKLPGEVAEVVKELGYNSKKIGIEMGPLGCTWIPRPLNDIRAFEAALGEAELVDGDKVIWGCRMIKSPLEVERISKAVDGHRSVQQALVEEFRPGMTEVDISIIAQRKAAELGYGYLGDSIGLWGSFRAAYDKEPMADIGIHEGATIGKGDYIFYDMCFEYKGYRPDNCRFLQVSEITSKMLKMYELVWKCEDAASDYIRPGVKANDLFQAMMEPAREAGLQVFDDMAGHGTGLDTHEPPSIDAWNEMVIEEGMVLSIEPWVSDGLKIDGGMGKLGIQDQFIVTDMGSVKIEGLRREIIQVSHPML